MYNGYVETPEQIEARKRRILASLAQEQAEANAKTRASLDQLADLIEQARGELGIRKLYVLQVRP